MGRWESWEQSSMPIKRFLTFKIDTISASGDEELEHRWIGSIGEISLEVITKC